ncbi:MAG: ATP-binding protein [Armatimonadetes bacterium]|nr:ATP-binding protein [Armatimonadota bacterium]
MRQDNRLLATAAVAVTLTTVVAGLGHARSEWLSVKARESVEVRAGLRVLDDAASWPETHMIGLAADPELREALMLRGAAADAAVSAFLHEILYRNKFYDQMVWFGADGRPRTRLRRVGGRLVTSRAAAMPGPAVGESLKPGRLAVATLQVVDGRAPVMRFALGLPRLAGRRTGYLLVDINSRIVFGPALGSGARSEGQYLFIARGRVWRIADRVGTMRAYPVRPGIDLASQRDGQRRTATGLWTWVSVDDSMRRRGLLVQAEPWLIACHIPRADIVALVWQSWWPALLVAALALAMLSQVFTHVRRLLVQRENMAEQLALAQALKVAEERLRLALDGSRLGAWHWDMVAERIEWSETYLALFGLPADARPSYDAWLASLHPDDRGQADRAVREAVESREPFRADYRAVWPDGSVRWIRAMGRCYYDGDGRPVRMEGIAEDVTEARAAADRIEQMNAELEQTVQLRTAEARAANAAKSEFLAQMSHEIRTPLNAVLGMAQLLQREPLTEGQRTTVGRIRGAGQSLLVILNDILDVSKIEAGQMRLEERPFELGAVLEAIRSLMEPAATMRGLALVVPDPPELGYLKGDALRLQQVLVNLAGNAIKFTEAGEVRVTVRAAEADEAGVRLRFEVRDTGIGIRKEALERLFAPFVQAEAGTTRRYGGTGLGLSICKSIVGLMRGTIGAESLPGEGSLFWFEVRFERAEADDAAPEPTHADATGPRLRGLRFLVVDDSAMNRELAQRALAAEGAGCDLASDGQQAVAVLRGRPDGYDAVLMDVRMPVMDGLTAVLMVRQELRLRDLPILALTAGVLAEERHAALEAGFNEVLAKPLDLDLLAPALLRWVREPLPATEAGDAEDSVPVPVLSGIDHSLAVRAVNGDGALYLRLLRLFTDEHAGAARRVEADLRAGASDDARLRLHTLRGGAGALGAQRIMELAEALEQAVRAGRTDLEEPLAALARRVDLLIDAARPVLPGSAVAPAATGYLNAARAVELTEALRSRDLGALALWQTMEAEVTASLNPDDAAQLAAAVRRLRFDDAAQLLARARTEPDGDPPT